MAIIWNNIAEGHPIAGEERKQEIKADKCEVCGKPKSLLRGLVELGGKARCPQCAEIYINEEIVNFRDVYPYETSQPVITQALITQAYWPFFGRYRRPFSSANQVSFLLASVMKDKNGIHWKNICNFICWFLANLDGSFYESKLDFPHGKGEDSIGGNTIVLKNQYQKIKGLFCYSKSSDEYFPQKDNRPQKPYLISNPVISVKFYKNKIKTIYRENDKLKVRESLFENDKENNVIREYEKDEEKNESSKPLMEIA